MAIAQDFENIIAEDFGGNGSGEIVVELSKVDKRVKGI
jgi:hypothetical protein